MGLYTNFEHDQHPVPSPSALQPYAPVLTAGLREDALSAESFLGRLRGTVVRGVDSEDGHRFAHH